MTTTPEHIHLIFKTHLDLGFTDLAEKVVEHYFSHYIPKAIETARQLRREGPSKRFIWTTGSWLIYEYLEQASSSERVLMEEAIHAGDITWHGLPFTVHSELLDASLFTYGLSLSRKLDHRFDTKTIAAKMTDVPGHTRGIVPLLAAADIKFLHIGVNPASTAPAVPPLFVWKDSTSGTDVMVMHQVGSYGDFASVPGSTTALAFAHTDDNLGPQSPTEVVEVYRHLGARFPRATIVASTLNAFAQELMSVKEHLPIVTEEIGDTWIHGAGADPQKISQFRELAHLRRHWLGEGTLQESEHRTDRFSNALLLVSEHTWGLDEKEYLNDYSQYTPMQLRTLRKEAHVQRFETSWREQRGYIEKAIQALGPSSEAKQAKQALARLVPRPIPNTDFQAIHDWTAYIDTTHFVLGFDARHGALTYLKQKATERVWATETHPLLLFWYECFSQADYDRFWQQYVINKAETAWWAIRDFTKPGIEHVAQAHQSWKPIVSFIGRREDQRGEQFLVEMGMPQDSTTNYGAPGKLILEINTLREDPALQITFQWFEKQASRLPEALWLSFRPLVTAEDGWRMEKLGSWISPREVVTNGNRKLHAVGTGVSYSDDAGSCLLETLDASLVAPGEPALLDFNNLQPSLNSGVHINLFNNVWGTNFPMWSDEDARFRFMLRFDPHV